MTKCFVKTIGKRREIASIKKNGSAADFPRMMEYWDKDKNQENPKDIPSESHDKYW